MLRITNACQDLLELMSQGSQTFIAKVLARVLIRRMNPRPGNSRSRYVLDMISGIFLSAWEVSTLAAKESDLEDTRKLVENLFSSEGRLESNTRLS